MQDLVLTVLFYSLGGNSICMQKKTRFYFLRGFLENLYSDFLFFCQERLTTSTWGLYKVPNTRGRKER